MSIEVEIKVKADPDSIRTKLTELGFEFKEQIREKDVYFDNPSGDIRSNDTALRVRTISYPGTDNTEAFITYKGRRSDAESMTRPEYETCVGSPEAVASVFEALGYSPAKPSVIKERTVFIREDLTACIDRVYDLGDFLELEVISDETGKDEALGRLWDTLYKLGYTKADSITTSYLSMLEALSGEKSDSVKMFRNINTVIFDMDGTVLNTLDDLTASVNYVLRQFNLAEREASEYRRYFGNGIEYALRCAVPEDTPDELIKEMLPVFREHYNAHCLDRTRPYDGILELMRILKDNRYKMAIVSNKIDSAVKELNNRFFSEYVSVAIGERDGIRRKPAPDTVLAALEELGSSKDEAVYIGDSEVDYQTAVNSGLPCISVLWGFRDKDFLIERGASVFADNPGNVYRILNR